MKEEKDKNQEQPKEEFGYIKPRNINAEMQESFLDYAMSVIVARALPDVRDGLKPVHRRILYAMNTLGLRSNSRYRKSATVVGEVLGKYHPHGDIAVYDTLVGMAQDFSRRYPLIDGQGNFGSRDGDNAAAMRYTEVKMAAISNEILADIEKDTVDFVPNYDGSQKEPLVLPSRLPTLILNGTTGIAVGMATKIPPHNLGEVIDATVQLIDNPESSLEDLLQFVKGPDFPTGCTIYDAKEIHSIYGTGKGSVVMRGTAEVVESKNGYSIIITEIPYEINKATLVTRIAELVKEKKIMGIADLRDESDRSGIRVVLDLKKDSFPKKIINQLYKLTSLQTSFYVNMLALIGGLEPRVLTLKLILEEFIKHREVVVRRRTQFDLTKAKERAHILEGLLIALKNIDAVIQTIKKSADKEEAHKNLMRKFKLTEIQAQAILDMRLQTLAGLEQQKIIDEHKEILKLIAELEAILKSPKKVLEIIKKELMDIKEKYGDERRTKVVKSSLDQFSEADLIPNEEVVVTLTRGNYIKRILSSTYRSQGRGGKGVIGMGTKEEDVVKHLVFANNHCNLLLFSNQGRVFHLKVWEIAQTQRTAKGQAVANLIQIGPDERITALVSLPDFTTGNHLFMATKKGIVKKTGIKHFEKVRRSGLIAIKIDKDDELKWVKATTGKDSIILATADGQAVCFQEKEVREMGRNARGVKGARLRKGDIMVGMDVMDIKKELLVIAENGYGKRTPLDQFTLHHRGGVGIKAAQITSKTGSLVDVRVIPKLNEDLLAISQQGQIIRVALKKISKIGRATQGVRIMKLNEKDKISSVALTEELVEEETL